MEPAHLHLMLNHVPVLGVVFGTAIGVIALLARSKAATRVALGMFVFAAIVAVPVYLTGEPAEEVVEKLAGVSETVIEQHESAAVFSLVLACITGGLALIALVLIRSASRLPVFFAAATLLLGILSTGSMLWTANLGGQVRHSEIRAAATTGTTDAGTASSQRKEEKEDDDD